MTDEGASVGRLPNWIAGLLLVAFLLSGCDQQAEIGQVPAQDLDLAKQYVALFQKSDFTAIEATINPELKTAQLRPTLMLMATMIPTTTPTSIAIVGADATNAEDGAKTTALKMEYQFPEAWLLVDIAIKRANGSATVDYVFFTPMATSWKEVNAFALGGKPLLSYAVLGLAILIAIFMVVSLIVCLVTPIPRRKWLWCILIFVGVGSLGLNWTTGEIVSQIVSIGIPNVWLGRLGVDGPYYLETYIPVGAIVFWIRRRAWLRDQTTTVPPPFQAS